MKRLAVLAALVWWGQSPLCLLLADASHEHGSGEAAAAGEQHHAGHGAAAPSAPERGDAPGDRSCAEHCTSLAQAVSVQVPSSAGPSVAWLALSLDAEAQTPMRLRFWRPSGALDEPPPEPTRQTSVLRL